MIVWMLCLLCSGEVRTEIPLPGPRLPCKFTHIQRKRELKSLRLRSKLVKECLQADIPTPLRWPLEYLDRWTDRILR